MKKKKKLLTEQEQEEIREIGLTEKGLFFMMMARHGFVPEVNGAHEWGKIDEFWNEFVSERDSLKEEVGKSIKCKSDKRRKERAKNSDVPIVPLILGILAGSIIGKLLFLLLKVSGIL
jgi:hypothetical protein